MKEHEPAQATQSEPGVPPAPGAARRWLARRKILVLSRFDELSSLFSRGLASLRTRGVLPTLRMLARRSFPARLQPFTLVRYEGPLDPGEIRLPVATPRASIIVPAYNQFPFTLRCLQSLARSGDRTPFEVIVVDDASSDATASQLPLVEGLRYLRNAGNLGFIGSCNVGAAKAHGEFLVFLNNDTVVQPGWLDALLDTFASHPDTGLAGSKLVYPDGRLQEAGGIIHSNGRAANVGRGEDPADPRYNFVREADYCSGAAIAIPRALFAQLRGFDPHYRPAYYEDTDLAMRVREHGLKVRYQPASVVVHFEGVSSGTDPRRGVKAYQAVNEKKFLARWQARLAQSHPPMDASDKDGLAASVAANHRARRRILVIDSYTPAPDRDSGSARLVELMRLLLEEGCSVVFIPQSLAHDGPYTEALQQMGVEVWWQPWVKSLPRWLARHGARLDAIIVSRHYLLAPLLPMLRELAPRAKIVFDTVDLHFLRERREAELSASPTALAAADRTREAELRLIRHVDATWVVSHVERELLRPLAGAATIEVVSNIHRIAADTPGHGERRDLVFVGSFRHPPNVDGVIWLVEEILPRVLREHPDIRLHLVGADAPASVLALASHEGVDFHGHVPDLDALLDRSRISLAPLRFGAGIKGKVNQALARGLPVVATSCAVEGMFLEDGTDVLRADDADDFAAAILRLYDDAVLWQALREAGFENTRRYFSRESARAVLAPWLRDLPKAGRDSA